MSRLLLPPHVEREIQKREWAQQRAQRRAILDRLLDFEDPVCVRWRPELRKLDPFLSLARARPQAFEPGYEIRPGFYHWVRDNPTAPASVSAITGADGESFAEPDSRLLDALRANDLQNPRVYAALIAATAGREAQEDAQRLARREARQGELMERVDAATRTQVSLNSETPWAQNAEGYKRTRGNRRPA